MDTILECSFPSPVQAYLSSVAVAADSFLVPRKVPLVKLCIAPYNLTVEGPVTGTTVNGYPCDQFNKAIVSKLGGVGGRCDGTSD